MEPSSQSPARDSHERLQCQRDQRRHQDEHKPERHDLPTDQRTGGQEVGILRQQIEERLRDRERRQRSEVEAGDGERYDRWRAQRTHAATE